MTSRTGRYVMLIAAALLVGVPAVAGAFGEGRDLKLGKRNPSPNTSLALNSETEIIANSSTYGTRQSNKRDGDGGGAIYGCRSAAGNEPCVRAINLRDGRAFEFQTAGKEGGRIQVGDAAGAPFTTNATGVATGLNADRVDGKDAGELAAAADLAFAAVDATGRLTGDRGAAEAKLVDAANGTYSVTFERDVKACSFTVSQQGATANGDVAFATSVATDGKTVLVDQADEAADRADFHLQVVC
ncbi:MAG TPA: hypothetical protein VM266_08970 [Solirubrobacteraceae bacterium]|nr:hypothetical protein [Solirubrobacteraceae bacterium]